MATVRRVFVKGGIAKLNQAIKDLEKLDLQVGWFDTAKYDDEEQTPVAQVAVQNEYGSAPQRIPPRPFFRPTIEQNQTQWKSLSASGIKAILEGNETANSMMEKMGLLISGQIRKSITKVNAPPLAPFTIKQRLSKRKDQNTLGLLDKPLVFEGILLNSVSYIVQGGDIKSPFGGG